MINNRNGYTLEQDNLSVESAEESVYIRPNTPIQYLQQPSTSHQNELL